jgi:predicted ATP-binding protein involved in virulence
MRIKRVFVERLFSLFDHEIHMNMEDRITIIHAPNGFGKTAILRMVEGLFQGRYADLRSFPFAAFGVEFEDGRTLKVEAHERQKSAKETKKQKHRGTDDRFLVIDFNGNTPFEVPAAADPRAMRLPLEAVDRVVPELTCIGPQQWQTPLGEILNFDDVFSRYPQISQFFPADITREPPWLKEVRTGTDVQFIRAERLMARPQSNAEPPHERRPVLSPAVMRYSEELAGAIGTTLTRYAELSQSLDRSFPVRLVGQSGREGLTEEEIKSRLSEFEAKRRRLTESGLLDQESGPAFQIPSTIDDTKASVLSVYVRDVDNKLAVFDELAGKIDLLKGIINRRFRHKRMVVSRNSGIRFTTDTGQPLDPTSLSSGEQHELVMLYELLFKVRRDSLILIDEPEISLHIAWQQEFLQDLSEMVRLSGFDVLIATHSPQIINDRWDLTVELHDTPELQEAAR